MPGRFRAGRHKPRRTGSQSSAMGPFDPMSLSPSLWLKADALGLADGAAVASWTDSSGNARHATQATGTKQPTQQTNELNGLPSVLFDGVDDRLVSGALLADASRTIFLVARMAVAADLRYIMGVASQAQVASRTGGTTGWSWVADNAGGVQAISATVSTAAGVVTISGASNASMATYLNGIAGAAFDPHDNWGVASISLFLGSRSDDLAHANVHVFEVLVYDTTLSAGDRTNVEGYLKTKWGTP